MALDLNTNNNITIITKDFFPYSEIDARTNSSVINQYMEIKMLESMSFSKIDKLGDFLVPMMRYPLDNPNKEWFQLLSPSVAAETKEEISTFLKNVLRNVTNEPEITWNLIDAADIFIITGFLDYEYVFVNYYIFS